MFVSVFIVTSQDVPDKDAKPSVDFSKSGMEADIYDIFLYLCSYYSTRLEASNVPRCYILALGFLGFK